MKRAPKITVLIVFLFLGVGCSTSSLQTLESKLIGFENENDPEINPTLNRLKEKASTLLSLKVGKQRYPACSVYVCPELEKQFVCQYLSADDTIHTTEFDEGCSAVPSNGSPIQVSFESGMARDLLVFYFAHPRKMHESGYSSVETVPLENGVLRVSKNLDGKHILFTIVKRPGDALYKKFVWVLDSGRS